MGLSIFTIPDFIEKLCGRLKGQGSIPTSEQKTISNANKRFHRLISRGDRHVLNGELPNVQLKDYEKVQKMGAKMREDGSLYVPEGVNREPFRMYSPMVAEDLDDEHSTYKVTSDGLPWENFVTPTDTTQGGDSTATSIVYGMVPVLAALTIVLLALPGPWALLACLPAALVIPHLIALYQGESITEAVKSGFVGFILPVLLSLNVVSTVKTGKAVAALDEAQLVSTTQGFKLADVVAGLTNFATGQWGLVGNISMALGLFIVGSGFVMLIGSLVNAGNDSKVGGAVQGGKAWVWAYAKLCLALGLVLSLPPVMAPWVILLFASAYAMRYTEQNFQARGWVLDQQNKRIGGVMQDHSYQRDMEDRQFQRMNVENDKSPDIVIAISTGYLARKGYNFSPDQNKFMVMSINDMCTHMLNLGRTGIGKTTNFARLIALQIALAAMNGYRVGLFVLCGKGTLPGEVRNALDWNIKPGMAVGLIEGLKAMDLADAINSMVASSSDKDKMWSQGADNFVVNTCLIFEALCEHEKTVYKKAVSELTKIDAMLPNLEFIVKQLNSNPDTKKTEQHHKAVRELQDTRNRREFYAKEVSRPREWQWSYDHFVKTKTMLNDIVVPKGGEKGEIGPEIKRWFNFLGVNVQGESRSPIAIHPKIQVEGSALQKAVGYIAEIWAPYAHEQRQSFLLNVDQRINPLYQSEQLVDENGTPWTALTSGVDITGVMRGERIGIDLPEALYKSAGTAVQILLKQRVYAKLRSRVEATDWHKEMPDETVFIQLMDECQLLVSKQEKDLLPIIRSLGMGAVYLTQNVEGLMQCFQTREELDAFLDCFQSVTCSMASKASYEWVAGKVGHGSIVQYEPTGRGFDYKASTNAFKRSTLNVDDHPQRAFLRKLKRFGMGKVVSQDMLVSDYGHRWDQKMQALQGTNVGESAGSKMRSAIIVGGAGSAKDGEIVSAVELERELNTSGGTRALVYLNRGNVRRVDFAKTIPVTPGKVDKYMERFKAERLEPENFQNELA